jgi:hypothetical protein
MAGIQLRDWQEPYARKIQAALEQKKFCIAACCTGSGKTFLSCDVMKAMGGRWIVSAPKVTLPQWRRVAEGFGIGDKVEVVNPERISRPGSTPFYDGQRWHLPLDTRGVVCDEFHRGCSGTESNFTQAIARLKAYGVAGMFLSATPAVSPLQMRAVAWWGGLSMFDKNSFYNWCRQNGVSKVTIRDREIWQFTRNKVKAAEHMKNIRAKFGDQFITLSPDEIPGFPTETVDIVYVDLAKSDRATVDEAYASMSERLKRPAKDDLTAVNKERERVEYVMAENIAQLMANCEEDVSAVAFFNFTEPRKRFEEKLEKLTGEPIARIYGGQKDEERQRDIDAFQADKIRFASVMSAAGGVGVSLHGDPSIDPRPRESFLVPSYLACEIKQDFGRTRRVGGKHATQHVVIAAGTVQERVAKAVERKLENLDALCDADLMI